MLQESEKQALIRPTIHHFGVTTTQPEEMLDWYAKVLGMTTNFQSSHELAFLSNNWAHHRLALLSLPAMRDNLDIHPHAKLQHVAFEYATIDDLLSTFERLKGLGIEPVLAADHSPTTAFYYQDPNGNSARLFVDTFGDWEKSSDYLRTSPQFHQNPMGTYIDPAQMMATRKAEATGAELHRRATAGSFAPARPMNPGVLLERMCDGIPSSSM